MDLPTYAFDRQRYWLTSATGKTDATGLGVRGAEHALLNAELVSAADDAHIYGGRLSVQTQPWLADHVVWGTVVVPGAALVEMALHAGAQAACDTIEELTLAAPLVLPEQGARAVQLHLSAPDDHGRRRVTIHSRPADSPHGDWTRHAEGILVPTAADAPEPLSDWPPAGAAAVPVEPVYEHLHRLGVDHGPTFRGLRGAWRTDEAVFAEVALPDDVATSGFGIHPALLDASLHALGLTDDADTDADGARLPFAWSQVTLAAVGATSLRVRITRTGTAVALTLADQTGAPVARIGSLLSRPVAAGQLDAASPAELPLYDLRWTAVPLPAQPATGIVALDTAGPASVTLPGGLAALADAIDTGQHNPRLVLLAAGDTPSGEPLGVTHRRLADVLTAVQQWSADTRFTDRRLVVLTRGAVSADPADPVTDLAGAAVWGLVRSAQLEHPDRFVLVDLDTDVDADLLGRALASGEPQLAVRRGTLLVPRLAPADPHPGNTTELLPDGTVLVTGATGTLGGIIARHLVTAHKVRRLLLVSRRGEDAPGAADLLADLTRLGAHAQLVAADLADRDAVAALLATVPAEHPLTGVVHTAGALDDAVVTALTPQRTTAVLRAKADAAWHLHELTRHLDLSMFVLFSSIAGPFGAPGQGNYAAANAFLDGLAHQRHAAGLAATSLAWGMWAEGSAMTRNLGASSRDRMARQGLAPLDTEQALALFDTSRRSRQPLLVPVRIDLAKLRTLTTVDHLPAPLRALAGTRTRRGTAATSPAGGFRDRIAVAPDADRRRLVEELVTGQVAEILGYASAVAVGPAQSFTELGFDSLTAVELRNRLTAQTGVALPATLIFDHPTPEALADYLVGQLGPAPATPTLLEGLDRLEAAFSATSAETLAELTADEQTRSEVAARLRALLTRWEGEAADTDTDTVVASLDDASDDELFDFIDSRFGRS